MNGRRIRRNDVVTNKIFGQGVVQSEWGSWHSCRACNSPTAKPKDPSAGSVNSKRSLLEPLYCPACRKVQPVKYLHGNGIFDVLFGEDTHPVHKSNLIVI